LGNIVHDCNQFTGYLGSWPRTDARPDAKEGTVRVTALRGLLGNLSRRSALAVAFTVALLLLFFAGEGQAAVEDLAKAAAWRLGDQLSLAGLLYAQGNQDAKVEELLASIKPVAEAMELEIKPFPPRSADSSQTYADVIHYLIQGDGADLGREIAEKFGNAAGTLFEVSVKSNLLILLYQPGEDQGIGGVIQSRMSEIGMPENLWIGVVTAINNKASEGDVKEAVFKMHDDVATYLGQQID
jgi:hypothetical protein